MFQQRLRWMRDVLMPVLSAALGRLEQRARPDRIDGAGHYDGNEFPPAQYRLFRIADAHVGIRISPVWNTLSGR